MSVLNKQPGMSLIELAVSLAIAALIVPLIAGVVFLVQFAPGRSESDVKTQQDLKLVGQWLTTDANMAASFSTDSLAPNEYGVFIWTEYGGASPVTTTATYLYDTTTTSLIREVEKDGVSFERNDVARNIASFEDISFTHTASTFELITSTSQFVFRPGQVTLTATSTVEKVGTYPAQLTTTAVAELRVQFERAVQAPGGLAPGVIATEDWERGDFTHGFGWLGNQWTVLGGANAAVTDKDPPVFEGVFHLRIRKDGSVSRDVDLSGRTGVHLTFSARVTSFEAGDTAIVEVSPDGVSFTTVKTFTSADSDDTYHFVDIDLSSFTMSSQFFIAFDGIMNATQDKWYIDDIVVKETVGPTPTPTLTPTATPTPTPTATPTPTPVASDDFESGGLTGGTGWLDNWTTVGTVTVTSANGPFEGTFHMEVDKGSEAKRSTDLSGQSTLRWQFQAKVSGLSGQRQAHAFVSSDGTNWTEVRTWTTADPDNTYQFEDIDLSPYTMSSQFWIRFSVDGGGGNRSLFVDDLKITQ